MRPEARWEPAVSNLLCRIFGHKRECSPSAHLSWHQRHWSYWRCTRCRAGEPECWTPGWTENLHHRWLDLKSAVARWFAQPAPKDVDDDESIPF